MLTLKLKPTNLPSKPTNDYEVFDADRRRAEIGPMLHLITGQLELKEAAN
jgi:hypothetical protein